MISLGRGCDSKGIAIHEMMHALGFFHEQSRRDRDNYVQINWSYIPRGLWYNFKKYQPGEADTLGEPYDKQSIMHYGNYAFTTRRGQKTIVSKTNSQEVLGQRRGLSEIDVKQLKKYYKCRGAPEPASCTDGYTFCVALKSYCKGNQVEKWVVKNCKYTCELCEKANKQCKNNPTYEHSCDGWAQNSKNYCSTYKSWMGKHCARSCCDKQNVRCKECKME
jgi:hypothetical protein